MLNVSHLCPFLCHYYPFIIPKQGVIYTEHPIPLGTFGPNLALAYHSGSDKHEMSTLIDHTSRARVYGCGGVHRGIRISIHHYVYP